MRILITGSSGFIGTHLLDALLAEGGHEVQNLDRRPPKKEAHRPFWQAVDLLEPEGLTAAVHAFQPEAVVHLAARTDTESERVADYRDNTEGTANLLAALRDLEGLQRLIITSSQFVHQPGPLPAHDEAFDPHTAYGESKVITEQQTRAADLPCTWTIIRPTNIWGPWHPRYPYEFWDVLRRGRYVHPGGAPVIRCYGYVKNVVWQMQQMLIAPAATVHQQVFYVGDPPIHLVEWVDGFARAITGKNVRVVPRVFLRALALVGDVLQALGQSFPIFSSRFQSMTQDYPTPMEKTLQVFGLPPRSMQDGIEETVAWLREQGFFEGRMADRS